MSAVQRTGVLLILALVVATPNMALASAFVRGAYYRLGDDDPGAMAGSIGNDPTQDSFVEDLDLARFGSPRYSADVPLFGPFGSKLSMALANEGLGGPAFPGFYGRDDSLPVVEQGYALETWVKAGPTDLDAPDSIRNSLIAYNGQPESNGFGLFLHGEDYVARIGSFERVLGPATIGEWHHLAYVQSLGSASYFYDGKLVHETTADPLPAAAQGGFWLGGLASGANDEGTFLFNGWIDEVRYQSFNPLAAGSFNPLDFLISPALPSGDYNDDGVVDAADFVVWRKADGTPQGYEAWRANFGQQTSSGGPSASVPEPMTLVLAGIVAAALLRRAEHGRRREHRPSGPTAQAASV